MSGNNLGIKFLIQSKDVSYFSPYIYLNIKVILELDIIAEMN